MSYISKELFSYTMDNCNSNWKTFRFALNRVTLEWSLLLLINAVRKVD